MSAIRPLTTGVGRSEVRRLIGWGLRPPLEFEIDPLDGRYTKRRLKSEPTLLHGYAGFGQELNVRGLGIALCSVFVHQQDIVLRVGASVWNLFQPGLEIVHREGTWHCELSVHDPRGEQTTFRYRRKDLLLAIVDSTYDALDFELAHLPATLPSLARRSRGELVAEWSTRAATQHGGALWNENVSGTEI
jgi:hypothetical protein